MKPIKYTALVMALALLVGCATTFRPWKLSEIAEGMDRTQVVGILGEPDSVEMKNGEELLYYSYSEDYNPSFSNDSMQTYEINRKLQQQQAKKSLKEYRYIVRMVDGKVLSYEELMD